MVHFLAATARVGEFIPKGETPKMPDPAAMLVIGRLPPVDLRAVCFKRAMRLCWEANNPHM